MSRLQGFVGVCCLSLTTSAAAQTRVACVGDSITEGYGLGSPQQDAYPAQLQGLLGNEYDVENFGVSGTTARKQGDKPYWNQGAYTQSTNFDADIVLLMLGTNDAKPANWNAASFRADYTELVAHYADRGARVFVATPPKVFGNGAFDISPTTVSDTLVPLVRELATNTNAALVDVFAATADHAAWFPDNVHPSRQGAQLLAETFAAAVTASLGGETSGSASGRSWDNASTVGPAASASSDAAATPPSEPNTSEPVVPSAPSTAPSTPAQSTASSTAAPTNVPTANVPTTTPASATSNGAVSPIPGGAAATDGAPTVTPSGASGLGPATSDTAGTPPASAAPHDSSSCNVMRVASPGADTWAMLLAATCALVLRRDSARRGASFRARGLPRR